MSVDDEEEEWEDGDSDEDMEDDHALKYEDNSLSDPVSSDDD